MNDKNSTQCIAMNNGSQPTVNSQRVAKKTVIISACLWMKIAHTDFCLTVSVVQSIVCLSHFPRSHLCVFVFVYTEFISCVWNEVHCMRCDRRHSAPARWCSAWWWCQSIGTSNWMLRRELIRKVQSEQDNKHRCGYILCVSFGCRLSCHASAHTNKTY